jgi:hypothetical protein
LRSGFIGFSQTALFYEKGVSALLFHDPSYSLGWTSTWASARGNAFSSFRVGILTETIARQKHWEE